MEAACTCWWVCLSGSCSCRRLCRFFFLSNDELLEILAEAKEPRNVQPFVKKCFEAVKEFVFADDGKITGMVSVEGKLANTTGTAVLETARSFASLVGNCRVCINYTHMCSHSACVGDPCFVMSVTSYLSVYACAYICMHAQICDKYNMHKNIYTFDYLLMSPCIAL